MIRHVRPAFYDDITREELWLLEHTDAQTADRWHAALWDTIYFLEQHPLIGRPRTDLAHRGIRSWRIKAFERWLIFYSVRDNVLVLLRVVSGTMDLAGLTVR